jgi:hypothetical protein
VAARGAFDSGAKADVRPNQAWALEVGADRLAVGCSSSPRLSMSHVANPTAASQDRGGGLKPLVRAFLTARVCTQFATLLCDAPPMAHKVRAVTPSFCARRSGLRLGWLN